MLDLDSGRQTRLTFDPAEDYNPSWSPDALRIRGVDSPDGTAISFYTDRDGYETVYLMDPDGSNPRPVVPGWRRSPDGAP